MCVYCETVRKKKEKKQQAREGVRGDKVSEGGQVARGKGEKREKGKKTAVRERRILAVPA